MTSVVVDQKCIYTSPPGGKGATGLSKRPLTIDRRSLLAIGSGATCAAVAHWFDADAVRAQQASTPVVAGDCGVQPGVELLIGWSQGQIQLPPDELRAPLDWVVFAHPNSPSSLLVPPDWGWQIGWADSFTPSGAPIWQETPPATPQLTGVRLISGDGTAAYEYTSGTILGPPLEPAQVAVVAQQGTLGERPALQLICSISDQNPLRPAWLTADWVGESVLVTTGSAVPLQDAFMPATVVTYQNFVGPSAQFEELMRTVFIRFLFQLLSGGTAADPTPTPTPVR